MRAAQLRVSISLYGKITAGSWSTLFPKLVEFQRASSCPCSRSTGPVPGHKRLGRDSVSPACPHTHALSCCRTPARYIIQGGPLSASDQQQARRLSKAVLSRSRLKLPEPAGCLAATGICLPWPIFACLWHGRLPSLQEDVGAQSGCLPGPGSGKLQFMQDHHFAISLLFIPHILFKYSRPFHG